MAFYVYILQCTESSYYAGHTDDIELRMAAHEMGMIKGYTWGRRPVRLVFVQDFPSRDDAFQRERQIKGWSRAKKEALICGDWGGLIKLAKARGSTGSPRAEGQRPN